MTLEADYPRSGGVIYLPSTVTANGFLITTTSLGADGSGGYYFQMAEAYAGYSVTPSKTIDFSTFECRVFADSPRRVLTNDNENLAYDFNVSQIGENAYAAVFHSEAYAQAAGSSGDSSAVRYASSPDSLFGTRTGADAGDHIVTRTENASSYMYGGSTGPLGQGGNPVLIRRPSDTPNWALFYLGVTDLGAVSGWRHYLMVGHPWDIASMTNTSWASLSNDGSGDYWNWFCGSPYTSCGSIGKDLSGNRRSYHPIPARTASTTVPVASAFAGTSVGDTQGLIGNISFGPDASTMHLLYIDYETSYGSGYATFRRDSYDANTVNWWSAPTKVMDGWATKIAYAPSRSRWAVLSACSVNSKEDVCLQFSSGSSISTLSAMTAVPASPQTYSLGLSDWFRDAQTGGIMEQFGILKNPAGQIVGDDFRVYVTERGTGSAGGLYGMDVSAIRVTCQAK